MSNNFTFIDRIQDQAIKQPGKAAFTFLQDGETQLDSLTFQQLDTQARAVATILQSHGAKGERALLLYQPGLEFICAFLGCLYAGVIATPAYPPRANSSISRLLAIVQDAEAKFALTTHSLKDKIATKFANHSSEEKVTFIATDNIDLNLATDWQKPKLTQDNLAFLQYTSGSTGIPKGVMVSHGNIIANSKSIARCFQNKPEHIGVSWLPPYHDMGLIGCIIQPAYIGISMYMMAPVTFLQRPYRWLEVISRYGGNTSGGPNFAYELCVNQITPEQRDSLDLSGWKLAFSGAEPVRAETIDKFAEYFAPCGFRKEAFYPCYGMAESTLIITGGSKQAKPVIDSFDSKTLTENKAIPSVKSATSTTLVSSGQNIPGQKIVIANSDNLTKCNDGEIGEIWSTSDSVAQGYWQRKEQTKEIFNAYLADTGEGPFLRTGDLGFLNKGELFVTGRLKDLIIIRGRNYYPQDIELTVDNSHPAVRIGCSAAFAVEIDGKEQLAITQEVKRSYLRKLNVEEVTKAIRTKVAQEHELQPYAIVLLKTGSIPKTSSGKIRRHACKAGFREGSLNVVGEWKLSGLSTKITNRTPPVGAVGELRLQDLQIHSIINPQKENIQNWLIANLAGRLGLSTEEININEPLANYGLDSLQAVRLSAELEDWLKIKLNPTLAYDYPTIASLATYLSGQQQEEIKIIDSSHSATTEPIAIIGMGCRFPHANNPEEFWQLLKEGKDAISEVKGRWQGDSWGGFVEGVDLFDPQFFGITPRETQKMDPQQRFLLEVSWEALENAGIAADKLSGSSTGVFIGISSSDYSQLRLHYDTPIDAYAGTGNAHSIAANRLSYFLDLRGPSLTVDTACSSSLVAVHLACQSLKQGECDRAIVGGVNLMLSPELTQTFSLAGMMAKDGRCKTFDADADGYVRGEGCGVVILKRLDKAIADKDNILAVIKGSAINQDGRSNGLTAPNGLSQQAVIRQALANAKTTPDKISYIEAHGTGTSLGDPIEVNSLKTVLMQGREKEQSCYLGSVKTNIGHLEAAAGIAGLIKTVLCLQHQAIPPNLHFRKLNPHIDLENTSITIPTKLQPWQESAKPRLAGVSSFGFGGTNAHVILQNSEFRIQKRCDPAEFLIRKGTRTEELNRDRPLHLLTLSAKNERALIDLTKHYAKFLADNQDIPLADICFTANTGRNHFDYRLAVAAASAEDLKAKLTNFQPNGRKSAVIYDRVIKEKRNKIVFLFTGQGSQYVGMGHQLYQTQPIFRQALDLCAEILTKYLDKPLLEIIFEKSEVRSSGGTFHGTSVQESGVSLNQTQYTQPAIFALEYALVQMWLSWGIKPNLVMGHSVGEYVAATIAGVFSLEDGLKLIAERGKLMQGLPQTGEMVAVFAELDTVTKAILPWENKVSIAAINSPQSIVISGEEIALAKVIKNLESQGIKTKKLNVSHAFHSPLMQPILAEFGQIAEQINYSVPQISIVSNVTGKLVTEAITKAQYWVEHIIAPVKFAQGMELLEQEKCNIFLEIGAKPILLGMGRQCLPKAKGLWLPSLRSGKQDWQQIFSSLASLYVRGIEIDWDSIEKDYQRQKVALPTYPFQRQSYWLEKTNKVLSLENNSQANLVPNLYQILWQEKTEELPVITQEDAKSYLIFADSQGVAEKITQELEQSGNNCLLVHRGEKYQSLGDRSWNINHLQLEDLEQVFTEAKITADSLQQIIYLWSLDSNGEDLDRDWSINCAGVLHLVQTLFKQNINTPIWLVTQENQAINNPLGQNSIASNSLWGLGKVLALEHPEYFGGLIDISSNSNAEEISNLITVINSKNKEDRLALRGEKIYVPRLEKFAQKSTQESPLHRPSGSTVCSSRETRPTQLFHRKSGATPRRFPPQGNAHQDATVPAVTGVPWLTIDTEAAYLITGGLGALGLQLAQWLTEKSAQHLILVGRSEPSKEAQIIIDRLEEKGIQITIAQADVTDKGQMAKVIEKAKTSIKGIIHAAGILDDGLMQNQTWQKFSQVISPKVLGAWNLHQLSVDLPLDFFVLFSSVASLVGSPGQSNYAAANAGLDAIARYRQARGLPALSINWGPWANAGMAVDKSVNRKGINLIEPRSGLKILEQLLASDTQAIPAQVGVLSADWNQLAQQFSYLRQTNYLSNLITEEKETKSQPTRKPQKDVLAELLAISSEKREEYLINYLKEVTAQVLQIDKDNIAVNDSLLDKGTDSIMVMEVIDRLKGDLNLMLYPREFYERPKINNLAKYLAVEFTSTHDKIQPSSSSASSAPPASHASPAPTDTPIAFILSSPRSGSTLLRVMLAGHPALSSPPELHLLPFENMQQRQKELGISHLGEGLQRAFMELKGIDAQASQALVDSITQENLSVREVYQMLQKLAGDRLLVDKSPTYASNRETLESSEAIFSNAKYIHLVRHPYAVIESFARMRMDKLIGAKNSNPYQLAESIWTNSNQNILDFQQLIDRDRLLLVQYEELVTQPRQVMERVCDFLAIPFDEAVLQPYQGDRMTDGVHSTSMSLGDPNFLNHQTIDAQLGETWRKIKLPSLLGTTAQQIARQLNYELPQEAAVSSSAIETTMEETLLIVRGLRLYLCAWGPKEGPLVLCLHGILEQGAAWSEVAIRLAQKGYRVIAPDLRGHGRSDHVGKGGSYNLMDFLADIDAIVDFLADRAFTLVGHSLGSVVAAIFASVRPQKVKNLVLVETILPTETEAENAAEQLATHLDYLISPPKHPVFPDVEAAAERLRQGTPAISKPLAMLLAKRITEPCEGGVRWRWAPLLRTRAGIGFNGIGRSSYLGLLKKIKVPITLVYGDKSSFNRDEDLAEQQAAMPKAQKVVLSGGHNLPLETPSGLAKIISSAVALTSKLIP
ncbi:MAG: alpha/beta fold hydrolase [Xenococcaceae cyanobacterium MO_188.B29]|nr:alpha/beta fold hydrolase [Xenococcaceae cyanobacterium MO_188.B29]